MITAAKRLLFGAAVLWTAAGLPLAAQPAVRSAPTRPGPPAVTVAVTRIDGLDYVSATDVAVRLGLKGDWKEPGRRLTLADRTSKVELEATSREIAVNGLRIFLGDPIAARRGELYISRIDFERRLLPLVRPVLAGPPPPAPRVIVLDPGHGIPDDGMKNERLGLMERVFTLDVAQRAKKLLEAGGYRVVLTRTGDQALSPEKKMDFLMRDEVANRAKADLFISIHFNSLYPDTRTSGTEVYTYAPRSQHAVDWWGEMKKDDPDVEWSDQPVNRYDCWSTVLVRALHRDLLASLKTADRGAKIKHLAVLRNLNCPAVLIESAFLSSDTEALRVATPAFRQQTAEAIAAGVRDYAAALEALRTP
jgi:N-acetylmuramoyl-L-alanine amidase